MGMCSISRPTVLTKFYLSTFLLRPTLGHPIFYGCLMLSRWARLFWFMLFAALLPMQGQTAASYSETNQQILSQEWQQAVVFSQRLPLDSEIGNTSLEVDSSPTTEAPRIGQQQGILYSPRWLMSEMHWQDEDDADAYRSGLAIIPCLNASSLMMTVALWAELPYLHFHSAHRLSGWKETNAMYVALNSQFFTA